MKETIVPPPPFFTVALFSIAAQPKTGDIFVVDTAGFNDKTVMDWVGHFHSEALRMTERFHRRDFGHLDIEMTFDDPKVYTRPFTIKVPHVLLADQDIFEMFCNENEKDRAPPLLLDQVRPKIWLQPDVSGQSLPSRGQQTLFGA